MDCPYCNKGMRKGNIHSDRYALKWIAEEDDKFSILFPLSKGIKLTNLEKSYITVYYCESCNKMVIDLDNK